MKLEKTDNQSDKEYIREKLIEHNMSQLPNHLKTPKESICFTVTSENGDIIGGITGTMYWHHLHIDFLWVDERHRSKVYGAQLLKQAEILAEQKQCRLIFLDTFSFQAPEFYQKQGYQVFGVLEDHPKGFDQYFLQKRL
ncbi:GNAT family N-acetyltransferase [Sediminibacillus dalangtanensis]|uniref:GNAT family N-acetyltransferase n=1 Tax=Sediminibacillus dalangtanensis TaxID=2729421 RepID=A0ABX7VPM3_9BACI|nr:GNAT family N-acetyltransferase [Sediminibacillus dalangtanensis]QTM98841.1 GNAT family N-acetyltransferase [Sediminibacillus dalangtanensis]